MPDFGGIENLRGTSYEIDAALHRLIEMLDGTYTKFVYQPITEETVVGDLVKDLPGIDFTFVDSNGVESHFQAKKRSTSGEWTLKRLIAEQVINNFYQIHSSNPKCRLIFVSDKAAPKMDCLVKIAKSTQRFEAFRLTITQGRKMTDALNLCPIFSFDRKQASLRKLWNKIAGKLDAKIVKLAKKKIGNENFTRLRKKAKASSSSSVFIEKLQSENKGCIDEMARELGIAARKKWTVIWRFLRQCEILIETQPLQQSLYKNSSRNVFDCPDTVAAHITRELLNKGSIQWDEGALVSFLNSKGIYKKASVCSENLKLLVAKASSPVRELNNSTNGVHIKRPVVDKILSWLDSDESEKSISFLTDKKGTGKTGVVKDLLVALEAKCIPVLAIKSDRLCEVKQPTDVVAKLGLPDSVEAVLSSLTHSTVKNRFVLLVDQLDALSSVHFQNQTALNTLLGLITSVVGLQGARVLVSCRSFHAEFDPSLRTLKTKRRFTLRSFSASEINRVISQFGLCTRDLGQDLIELLKTPLHLSVFVRLLPASIRSLAGLKSLQDLYTELWAQMENTLDEISVSAVTEAAYRLVDLIDSEQSLNQPRSKLRGGETGLKILESNDLIVSQTGQISFFHQTLFDYLFAKRLVMDNVSLATRVLAGNQSLFERPQLLQSMEYLRALDGKRYISELRTLFWPNKSSSRSCSKLRLRYHLLRLLIQWFAQSGDPSDAELRVACELIQYKEMAKPFFCGAKGIVAWYNHLFRSNELFRSAYENNTYAFKDYLFSIINKRFEDIVKSASVSLEKEEYESFIGWALRILKNWNCSEAKRLFLGQLKKNSSPFTNFSSHFLNIADDSPEFACEALHALCKESLEHRLNGQFDPKPSCCVEIDDLRNETNEVAELVKSMRAYRLAEDAKRILPKDIGWLSHALRKVTVKCPEYYIEMFLPWLLKAMKLSSDEPESDDCFATCYQYSLARHRHGDAQTEIVYGLFKAISNIVIDESTFFDEITETISNCSYLPLHQCLVCGAYAGLRKSERGQNINCLATYLGKRPQHLTIRDPLVGGNASARLMSVLFRWLPKKDRASFEKLLISYIPYTEFWYSKEHREHNLRNLGRTQWEYFCLLPASTLTPLGLRRQAELKRKFGEKKTNDHYEETTFQPVLSPIPKANMKSLSDDKWIDVMREYDDETGWGRKREPFDKGGIVEIARQIEELSEGEPIRFAALAEKMPDDVSVRYIAAIVKGIAKSSYETSELFSLIDTLITSCKNNDEFMRAIGEAIEKRLPSIPNKPTVKAIHNKLLSPASEDELVYNIVSSDEKANDNYWANKGINTTRGALLETYVCFQYESNQLSSECVLELLRAISTNATIAVRSCLINVLPYVFRDNPQEGLKLFKDAVGDRWSLLDEGVTFNVLLQIARRDPVFVETYIRIMMGRPQERTRQRAGELAAFCALLHQGESRVTYSKIVSKGYQKVIKGAVKTLRLNVSYPACREFCFDELLAISAHNDKDIKKEIGKVFYHLGAPIGATKDFIDSLTGRLGEFEAEVSVCEYALNQCKLYPETAIELVGEAFRSIGDKSEGQVYGYGSYFGAINDIVSVAANVAGVVEDKVLAERGLRLLELVQRHEVPQAEKAFYEFDR